MDDITAEYLFTCKNSYFLKIYPADDNSKHTDVYKRLIEIAKSFFNSDRQKYFAGFLEESQYRVSLWTAHLILEFGKPNKSLIENCLNLIRDHSKSSLSVG
jgi:hypothetical protein